MNSAPKTYLITGASSGIGNAVCRRLLQQGHKVVALGRHLEQSFVDPPENLSLHHIDLADSTELYLLLKELSKSLTPDAYVGAAGYGQFGGLEQFSYDQIERLLQVNFLAHAHICRAFLPAFKGKSNSRIVLIGSEAALRGARMGSIYCASKFALRGFAQSLQEECGRNGVHVSLINPGMTAGEFYRELNFEPGSETQQRLESDDIAECVLNVLNARYGAVYQEINMAPLVKVVNKKMPGTSGSETNE